MLTPPMIMKKYLKGMALLAFAVSAMAQAPTKKEQEFQRLFEAKTKLMESTLELSAAQAAKFRVQYERYERAIADATKTVKRPRTEDPAFSKEDAMAFVSKRLAVSQAMLDAKKNNIPALAEVLTPVQTVKFFQAEADIRTKINREYKRRTDTSAP